MATRATLDQSEHDIVVRASAKTYGEMEQKGYKVSINAGGEKNQYIGPLTKPRYPDVVVWMPDSFGSTTGKAAIIEEIETADSVNDLEAEQWKDYGSLGVKFLLVVPKGYCNEALRLISKYEANGSEIWYYSLGFGNDVKFQRHR